MVVNNAVGREELWLWAYLAFREVRGVRGDWVCHQGDGAPSSLPCPGVLRVLAEYGQGQGLIGARVTWRQATCIASSLIKYPRKFSL